MKNKRFLSLLFIFCSLFSLSYLFSKQTPEEVIEEAENIFSSNYYTDYRQDLAKFHNHLSVNRQKEMSFLAELTPDFNSAQKRKAHEQLVLNLRQLLLRPEQKVNADALVNWLFLKSNRNESTLKYFYNIVNSPNGDIFSFLEKTQSELSTHPQFTGLKNQSRSEDHFFKGNLPAVLFTLGQPPHTTVIRMAQPVERMTRLKMPWTTLGIQPEFMSFIEAQKGHLYINLMKRHGLEGSASKTIENLDGKVEGFSVVSLDKNSKFYWQHEMHYPEILSYPQFKKKLHTHLTKKSGYYWSSNLHSGRWEERLIKMTSKVHQTYFDEKPQLNREERRDFIELLYLEILNALVEDLQPKSMNISCRQCMDRGPSVYVLWMYQKKLINHKEMAALLLAPPLLIDNRASHASRINRFITAAKRIED